MKCPNCDFEIPGVLCEVCGEETPRGSLYCCKCGAEIEVEEGGSFDLKNRVLFVGEVPKKDMPLYYGASNIAVISSRSEGTPNSLLECLAAGVPIVAMPVGGIPEIIKNGKTGLITENRSVEALERSLHQLITDAALRRRLAKNGRIWAEENLSWKKTVDNSGSKLYRSIRRALT